MKHIIAMLMLSMFFITPVSAAEITAPAVPSSASDLMPEEGESFAEGLVGILLDALGMLQPSLKEGLSVCVAVFSAVLLCSITQTLPASSTKVCDLVGGVAVAGLLLGGANSLLHLAADTVTELSEYGKLLLPVMTTALAAQGGITTSAGLYIGTAFFNSLLSMVIQKLMLPMVFLYLALAAANGAVGEDLLKQIRDLIKWILTWTLKTVLYIFTGYMGITGVVSGSTDAAALKATKLTISGMVPVVGGILSDASEAVLVSAGVAKNAAGIYGIFAIASIAAVPFLRIGLHYLLLKATSAVCTVFGSKRITGVVQDFASAMGLLLAMTGSVSLMLLISTVCFLRGIS